MTVTVHTESLSIQTTRRGTVDITSQVQAAVAASGVETGTCTVFVHHTSASLIICENADPTVRSDLERFVARLVPDGDRLFEHVDEGDDDMPAHVRSVLTQTSISLPVRDAGCALGTWQGIYLWEHRTAPHCRRITLTTIGNAALLGDKVTS